MEAEEAREEFLNKIENNIDTSFSSIIVRKLAGLLEPSIAYKLLSGASFPRNNIPTYTDNNVFSCKNVPSRERRVNKPKEYLARK